MPTATRAALDMVQDEAVQHLTEHVIKFQGQGVSVTAEVRRGDPVKVLTDAAREFGADLLVLRTHGKAGTQAFWSGSLGARLAGAIPISILLIPLGVK